MNSITTDVIEVLDDDSEQEVIDYYHVLEELGVGPVRQMRSINSTVSVLPNATKFLDFQGLGSRDWLLPWDRTFSQDQTPHSPQECQL